MERRNFLKLLGLAPISLPTFVKQIGKQEEPLTATEIISRSSGCYWPPTTNEVVLEIAIIPIDSYWIPAMPLEVGDQIFTEPLEKNGRLYKVMRHTGQWPRVCPQFKKPLHFPIRVPPAPESRP